MEDYKQLARERYERTKSENASQEAVKRAEEKAAEEALAADELELKNFYTTLEEWKNTYDMGLLVEPLKTMLPIAKKHGIMFHLEERVTELVEYLNRYCEQTTLSIPEIRLLQHQMQEIITLCEMDIPIQSMYTEDDEKFATILQQELFMEAATAPLMTHAPFMNTEQFGVDDDENGLNNLPLVHPYKRIGISLHEMKNIARMNGILVSGNKPELCMRLVNYGLCRLA